MWKLSLLILISTSALAKTQHGWGVNLIDGKKGLRIGGRIQAVIENSSATETQDQYLRRTRLNIVYSPWEDHVFVYDIRNDNANQGDAGEKEFNIGDAYWKIDTHHKYFVNNIKFFRSKVDVSYSQTSSSKNLFNPERAEVAEHASDFLVHNRRASNVQANGNIQNLAFQVAISDGVQSGDLEDLNGEEVTSVIGQKFTYGAKLRYYFIGDAQKNKVQDTFYGNANTFSIGLGHFRNDKIIYEYNAQEFSLSRNLTNLEFSLAISKLRILAEHFQMHGDLLDLTQTTRDEITGDSSGHYIQAEYIIGKWAPYFSHEEFDRNTSEEGFIGTTQTIGLNFYDLMEARRFGLAYKKYLSDEQLGDSDSDRVYAYLMLNF